jgi:hypothetical protein
MMRTSLSAPAAGAGAAAGPEAAGVAVAHALDAVADPALLLLFADGGLGPARAAAQAAAQAAGVPVAGLTSDVLLGVSGLVRGGCTALALGAPLAAAVGVAENASAGLRAAGRLAATLALNGIPEGGHRVLLLLLDAASGDQADAVSGAYEVAGGAVPLAGGAAAGDEARLFADGRALSDAVVAVAIHSPGPIGVGMAHGCTPRGVPAIVTEAAGRTVIALDGRPAVDVYLERLAAPSGMDDERFSDFAAVHPLAQVELSGGARMRHVLAREPNGALRVATAIPVDAAVHFTRQRPPAMIACAPEAVQQALEPLGGQPPRAALVFDCAGRKHVLGHDLPEEADAVLAAFGDQPPPLAGLYTRGEIARVRGAKGDRNHALVVVAFG